MLTKRIIPCLDVKNGKVVKGVKFRNLIDAGDPVELAELYVQEGADELVFLDITATLEERDVLYNLIEKIAEKVFIPFTIGGGISKKENVREILKRGADKISINSAAVFNPDLITELSDAFGSQCIMVAIDAKRSESGYEVYTHGGTRGTGIDAVEWARTAERKGAGEILLTSMDKDGSKSGFEVELTRQISTAIGIPVIASGGGGKLEHFSDVFRDGQADAALAASIFHFKEIRICDLKSFLSKKNIPMRLL